MRTLAVTLPVALVLMFLLKEPLLELLWASMQSWGQAKMYGLSRALSVRLFIYFIAAFIGYMLATSIISALIIFLAPRL